MLRVLKNRDVVIYFAGSFLSRLGDGILWPALAIWIASTANNTQAGFSSFAYVVGCMIAPVSGVLVDRFGPRKIAVSTGEPFSSRFMGLKSKDRTDGPPWPRRVAGATRRSVAEAAECRG
ncbi:hypothetical protein [Streptosporangium sp. NPDC000396]|uniref:hypothetical protein n=1 Tax=Streptosporangium sp. NPDC000396 TaxID=3366185 RepID=UPI0036B5944F